MSLEPVSTIHKSIEPTISLRLASRGSVSNDAKRSNKMPTIVNVAGAPVVRTVHILPKKVQVNSINDN